MPVIGNADFRVLIGKTVLSSTVVENVLNDDNTRERSSVLYFFFDFNDIDKQGCENMIRSLISQLSKYGANGHQILESV